MPIHSKDCANAVNFIVSHNSYLTLGCALIAEAARGYAGFLHHFSVLSQSPPLLPKAWWRSGDRRPASLQQVVCWAAIGGPAVLPREQAVLCSVHLTAGPGPLVNMCPSWEALSSLEKRPGMTCESRPPKATLWVPSAQGSKPLSCRAGYGSSHLLLCLSSGFLCLIKELRLSLHCGRESCFLSHWLPLLSSQHTCPDSVGPQILQYPWPPVSLLG